MTVAAAQSSSVAVDMLTKDCASRQSTTLFSTLARNVAGQPGMYSHSFLASMKEVSRDATVAGADGDVSAGPHQIDQRKQ